MSDFAFGGRAAPNSLLSEWCCHLRMSKLKRYYSDGQVYFISVVTARRRPILLDHPSAFLDAWKHMRTVIEFRMQAYVLMPNHFHAIIDPQHASLAEIIRRLKLTYTWRKSATERLETNRLWQPRFWDHIIRDDDDLHHHLDYIHYNPVKHGFASKAIDWEWSSFRHHVSQGLYISDWGSFVQFGPDDDYGE